MGFLTINSWKSASLAIIAGVMFVMISHTLSTGSEVEPPKGKKTVILDQSNFDKTIKEGVVLVDFWATWCGPCRIQGPIVEEVAKEMGKKATICKLDVDKNRAISSKYGIRSIPTIIIFKNGVQVKKLVGLRQKAELLNVLNQYID